MNDLRTRIAAFADSTAVFGHLTQPYYIVAPAFSDRSAGIRLLHQLCSLLNKLGYEAYVVTEDTNGLFWSPTLTAHQKKAHYLAGKKPIVVYPEVIRGAPMALGLPVRYALYFPGKYGQGDKTFPPDELVFKHRGLLYPTGRELHLPIVDLELFSPPPEGTERTLTLVYFNRYTGPLEDHGPDVVEISSKKQVPHRETAALYQRAKVMYAYEGATSTLEARLCGCPVVLVPNEQKLPAFDDDQTYYGTSGLAWGTGVEALKHANETIGRYREEYLASVSRWKDQLVEFIDVTQSAAEILPMEVAWPQSTVDSLPGVLVDPVDLAARADRFKWMRVHGQYKQWCQRSSLREIDGQIYAEHVANSRVLPLDVVIDHRLGGADRLADSIDSLFECLGSPASLTVMANEPPPDVLGDDSGIRWINVCQQSGGPLPEWPSSSEWTLLIQAGTTLAPQALMEWGMVPSMFPNALMAYADEDLHGTTEDSRYPFFKPDCNVELLRCMNYLGTAVAIRSDTWSQFQRPLMDSSLYSAALTLTHLAGRDVLAHLDTVLSHSGFRMLAGSESQEFDAAQVSLVNAGLARALKPLDRWGTWLVDYPEQTKATVSLVVSTGLQTGYLRSLLDALETFPQKPLRQIVLVCQNTHAPEVRNAAKAVKNLDVQCVVLPDAERYCHASALNAGAQVATGEFILFADDDTEPLHQDWLLPLMGILSQPDVGCVAPRLMSSKDTNPQVNGGPMFLGFGESAVPYCGEERRVNEVGVFSRLQLTQDVSTVAGHFFLVRAATWRTAGGLNADKFSLLNPVLDFCLRLNQQGLRHVWTPMTTVLHQGAKSLALLRRDKRSALWLAEQELTERDNLLALWGSELANDRNYNRHLSLLVPFDIEPDIVIDWNPRHHDRPRILSTAIRSAAGHFRVIDPLNGLQNEGLAQTCVVPPMHSGNLRVLSPLEVRRAAPDTLVLQHSVDDGQLDQVHRYKLTNPDLTIVQMVDDLFGEVPEKHPNRAFQSREGHQRMIRAIEMSDHLVVTTEPLRQFYEPHVARVSIVPNTLGREWFGLCKLPPQREKLRVGWVGAGQHAGDQGMIVELVKQTADRYDWVFMGMVIDDIRPHLKEFHSFVSIWEYPEKMRSLDLDIAIAPLEDNPFNTCKSNLRLLEYGAMGWPVVCSDVFPYRTQNPPVLRCTPNVEEWVKALDRLAVNDELRWKSGHALNRWVRDNFLLEDELSHWAQTLIGENHA